MYAIGTRVYCSTWDVLGEVERRSFVTYENGKKLAVYFVRTLEDLGPLVKGSLISSYSRGLIRADFNCDHCGKWRRGEGDGPRDCDGLLLAVYCYPCQKELRRY